MVIFNSYVKLPEGNYYLMIHLFCAMAPPNKLQSLIWMVLLAIFLDQTCGASPLGGLPVPLLVARFEEYRPQQPPETW